ncbi:MAG: hydantoinase/oxoprolinase family protein [Betaproteobacteria bacterium]|nr:hydantoinase/oxoprolinase family protein [Betaproteobacteria bacterium]
MSFRLGVDIGGTFTDLVALDETTGRVSRTKSLSTPRHLAKGVLSAILKAGIPLNQAGMFVHGSTIAINALLQLDGAETALITTRGFRDVLEMGRKNRPDMYNLFFKRPPVLVPRERRFEVAERLDAGGAVLSPVDPDEVETLVAALPPTVTALAVCLLHSYTNPDHERLVGSVVRNRRPDLYLSLSSDISRERQEYERTSTAVLNAYVGPKVSSYLVDLRADLTSRGLGETMFITQSNGGMMTIDMAVEQPLRTMESGPAAGVIGTAYICDQLGISNAIAFDMGGTSAKACVIEEGLPEMASEFYFGGRVTGLPVQGSFLEIIEVGAGGGSIAYADATGGLRVGPQSAGSEPGPICYGLGGTEPTVTDANLLVGKIDGKYFLGGEMILDSASAERALDVLGQEFGQSASEVANGIIRIANSMMSNAIRAVTVEKGRDPRDFTLVAYGGAGSLHAVAIAAELQIPTVLIPAGASTFAAFGMLTADVSHDVAHTMLARLDKVDGAELAENFATLEQEALKFLVLHGGVGSGPVRYIRKLDLRYLGQFHPLTLQVPADEQPAEIAGRISRLFHSAHLVRFGHNAPREPVEITAMRVTIVSEVPKPEALSIESPEKKLVGSTRRVLFESGEWVDCAVYYRDQLKEGEIVLGPAIIQETTTALPLRAGDSAQVLRGGHVKIRIGSTGDAS